METPVFSHEFSPGEIQFGRNCVENLGEVLSEHDLENALVVCGQTVGSTDAVINQINSGLGDRMAGIFDETSAKKELSTVFDGVEHVHDTDADAIVGVGGGSSLDIARGISALANADRTFEDVHGEVAKTGELTLPDGDFLQLFTVPTTMAGADLSVAAGLVASTDEGPIESVPVDNRFMPTGLFYDPNLFDTTPMEIQTGSAINGFDKGIEAIYSRFANPITDSTAVRGLKYLRTSLPRLRADPDPAIMERAVTGILLVQHGVSMPDAYKINIVHAFGHALRNQFGIQQGVAHGVVVPHALELIFADGGGRPSVLAEGLVTGEEDADTTEGAVVEAVRTVRDGLGLPARLRDIDGTTRKELQAVAEHAIEDPFIDVGPSEFHPSVDDIERMLQNAW